LSQALDANPSVFGYVIEGLEIVGELTIDDMITRITIENGL
jgi:hypothetical protein